MKRLSMDPADTHKLQKIRRHRLFYAVTTYLFVLSVVYLIGWSGIDDISRESWIALILVALVGNLIFLALFLSNLNLKLPDHSMTRLQIIYSAAWGVIGVLAAPNARALVLMLYLPSFMFGSLRLARREYLELVMIISAILACSLVAEYWYIRPDMNVAYEIVLWFCFTMILIWLALFGSYVYGTKQSL